MCDEDVGKNFFLLWLGSGVCSFLKLTLSTPGYYSSKKLYWLKLNLGYSVLLETQNEAGIFTTLIHIPYFYREKKMSGLVLSFLGPLLGLYYSSREETLLLLYTCLITFSNTLWASFCKIHLFAVCQTLLNARIIKPTRYHTSPQRE
jgi:hypothetical protein